jgi:hypothetical protein
MVLWNMPQRVGDRARMAFILRESRLAWEAFDRELRERGEGPVDGGWTASIVYAHVARWLERADERLQRHIEGAPDGAPENPVAEDALNQRWATEDVSLALEQARGRCEAAFERLHARLAELDPMEWDETVLQMAEDDALDHLRSHLHSMGVEA